MKAMTLAGFAIVALLAGCMESGMMGGADHARIEQALASARAEVSLHHATVTTASSMDRVRGELTRHESAMATIHNDVRLRVGQMGSCGDMTARAEMMGMMDDAMAMENEHAAAIGAAGTLDQVRAECDRYAAEMTQMHDRMDDRWGGMSCM